MRDEKDTIANKNSITVTVQTKPVLKLNSTVHSNGICEGIFSKGLDYFFCNYAYMYPLLRTTMWDRSIVEFALEVNSQRDPSGLTIEPFHFQQRHNRRKTIDIREE